MVYHAIDLDSIVADGLVGLAPNSPSDHPNPTIVSALYDHGVIGRNMFSIFLAHTDQESKIWFGGYDRSLIRKSLQGAESLGDAAVDELIAW